MLFSFVFSAVNKLKIKNIPAFVGEGHEVCLDHGLITNPKNCTVGTKKKHLGN
jgi:hypothetical protein